MGEGKGGRILALDISSTLGWCELNGETARTGVLRLEGERGEKAHALEMWLLRRGLGGRADLEELELVAFEEPLFFRGRGALLLAGLQIVVEKVCETHGIPYVSVPVSTLKKFATGHGGASKSDMVQAAEREGGLLAPTSHEADAFWVARWARERVDIGGEE